MRGKLSAPVNRVRWITVETSNGRYKRCIMLQKYCTSLIPGRNRCIFATDLNLSRVFNTFNLIIFDYCLAKMSFYLSIISF